jgi:murein DD-endopeptidase MepM/ murein hydrolase activator NlpD
MIGGERSGGSRRLHAIAGNVCLWSRKGQAISIGLVLVCSVVLTMTSASLVSSQSVLDERSKRILALRDASAGMVVDAPPGSGTQVDRIAELQARVRQQAATIASLITAKASLESRLRLRERELAGVIEQRDQARGLMEGIHAAIAGVENHLSAMMEERSFLREQLQSAQAQLIQISDQRDASRRMELGLRWRLTDLNDEIEHLRSHRERAQLWLRDWLLGSVAALEDVVDETGLDVENLIARAADDLAPGQGGPLQVTAPDEVAQSAQAAMSDDIQRLALLHRVARTLPLASPLDQFYVTSAYGKRRDPFARSWAFHSGLDLGAPRDADVLATAPGQVILAERSGPYGNMVEIDHGMGLVTRYAHLKSIGVEIGDQVGFRQIVGVIGSTGRSTSRHLHYEIKLDDRTLDPARFLDAGRLMVGIFDVSGREAAQ